MTDYREILRLLSLGYTQRQIAASVHCSRDTVRDTLYSSKKLGIKWPLEDSITNAYLYESFHPERFSAENQRKEPDYAYIHGELAKKGVNMSLLWSEYCTECYSGGETPYMYTQFCDKYRKWAKLTKATMRINHKPGDAMQVDWAGNTIPIYDHLGEITPAYVFIAVLPCSCYAYAEACTDMKSDSWLNCHIHAYSYFGGVTRLLIPDNLKTGVVKNTKYDTVLNKSYQELAEYYDTAIVPARVEHPKDKSLAEGTVKFASTWIIAALRNRKFFNISEVRQAVSEKLEELNRIPFKKREGNRYLAYINEERDFMKQLPVIPYEPAVWSTAMVQLDYLISDGKNKYSVPFDLIGEKVDIKLTKQFVEVFFNGSRVALHKRSDIQLRDPVILPAHMPEEHKKYLSYNADEFTAWATSVGPETSKVVNYFLKSGLEPEQGLKHCASLKKLSDKHGNNLIETTCKQINSYAKQPSIRVITTTLNGLRVSKPEGKNHDGKNGITRGAAYYAREVQND